MGLADLHVDTKSIADILQDAFYIVIPGGIVELNLGQCEMRVVGERLPPYHASVHFPRIAHGFINDCSLTLSEWGLLAARLDDVRLAFVEGKANRANVVGKDVETRNRSVQICSFIRKGAGERLGELPIQRVLQIPLRIS